MKGIYRMKKITSLLLVILLLIAAQSAVTFGQSIPSVVDRQIDSVETEYLGDGLYCITVIESLPADHTLNILAEKNISLASATTETKSKTKYTVNASGTTLWYVRVTGTFTYGNGTSKCIAVSHSADSYASTWKIVSSSDKKSGNSASATATARQYVDGSVISSRTQTVTLTCSSTGVFS